MALVDFQEKYFHQVTDYRLKRRKRRLVFYTVRLCGLKHAHENHRFRGIASNANGRPFTP